MRPKILLDIDGVCADFVGPVLSAARTIMGRPDLTIDMVDQWELTRALGMTDAQSDQLDHAISARGFCASLAPYPGAIAGVQALQEFADVYACTSPWDGDYWHREREQWCVKILGIPRNRIMQGAAKAELLFGNALVEDKTQTLRDWWEPDRGALAVLMEQPWNHNDRWDGHRVQNWNELVLLMCQRFQ